MPTPLLDSASNGPSPLISDWELPEVAPSGDDVLLVAAVQINPANTIDLPGGWTQRVQETGSITGAIRYVLCDRLVAADAAPYADTFGLASGSSRWHAFQMAFRSTAAVSGNTGSGATTHAGPAFATDPTETAPLDDLPNPGSVLLAYASLTTDTGSTFSTIDWPDGWIVLQTVGGSPFVGYAEVAYKVAAGDETEVEVAYTGNKIATTVVLVAEYPIEADPLPAPEGVAILLDVYRIMPPGDTIEYLATIDDATNKGIRPERNAPGSGQFTINRNSPNATAEVLAPGNLVKVRVPEIHSDHIFAFFLDRGDFTLLSPDEEGGEEFTFGGAGALDYWNRAIWLSSGFVIPWWPDDMEDPPAGAIGLLRAEAQRMAFYDVGIVGGKEVITDQDFVTVGAYDAYYDRRKTLSWPVSQGGPAGFRRHVVHIMAGEPHDTRWVHPSQRGVEDIRASFAIGDNILLTDIGDGDKPGQVIKRMYDEGIHASRPAHPIPLMTIDFDDTLDSDGNAWTETDALEGVTATLGETYLETIARLLALGVIDVEMGPDLDMHAYNSQGRDLGAGTFAANKVRFLKGVNIADELRREMEDQPVGTFVEVVGIDNAVGQVELPDAATRVTREVSLNGDTNTVDALEALGLANLQARLIRSDAIGFKIAAGDGELVGRYLPGPDYSDHGHFWLGDVVRLHTGSGEQDFDEEDLRVYAITISEDDAGNLDVTVEVGSVLGEAERRLYGIQPPSTAASFAVVSQFQDTEAAEQPDLTLFVTKSDGGLETLQAHGATGSTETIDLAAGNWHSLTLDDDCAITVTGFTADAGCSVLVKITQDGSAGHAINRESDIVFASGADDQPAQGAGAVSWFVLASDEGDGTIYGFPVGGGSAAPTFGTPAIVLGTVAAAGGTDEVIRRDSTIVAFDATVPVTQAFSDAAATGSAAFAARRDHVHGMPASSVTEAAVRDIGHWEVVVSGSAPPVAVSTPADDDWVYAWVPG